MEEIMECILNMFGLLRGITVRPGIADYSWMELKTIAQAIALAKKDAEGLRIAREYHLVGKSGMLQGESKPLTLIDGTRTNVRVLGFRHDRMERGRKAGISFELVDVPLRHRMNDACTNAGGWEVSEMRVWLNTHFLALMPSDVRCLVEPVMKRTNNWGKVAAENDASVVSDSVDWLWLLSMTEVYGKLSVQKDAPWSCATYDAEGTQYKLYAEKGVTLANRDFCKKAGASLWWWLRSPLALYSVGFCNVLDGGGWNSVFAYHGGGVSPCFCF